MLRFLLSLLILWGTTVFLILPMIKHFTKPVLKGVTKIDKEFEEVDELIKNNRQKKEND